MFLYHFHDAKKEVYKIEEGTSVEEVFSQTKDWPGRRLILVKG
jgi:hypothetical protein